MEGLGTSLDCSDLFSSSFYASSQWFAVISEVANYGLSLLCKLQSRTLVGLQPAVLVCETSRSNLKLLLMREEKSMRSICEKHRDAQIKVCNNENQRMCND